MFKTLIILVLKLLVLQGNYYVNQVKIDDKRTIFQVECRLEKEANRTNAIREYLFSVLVEKYKQIVPNLYKCKKSNNPKKCIIGLIDFNFSKYIMDINSFSDKEKKRIYKTFFWIIKHNPVTDSTIEEAVNYLLSDSNITKEIILSSNLGGGTFTSYVKKNVDLSNKNFPTILKTLFTDKSISRFKLNCSKIIIPNVRWHYKLSNSIIFFKGQDKTEIKYLLQNFNELTCDKETHICYGKSDVDDIKESMQQQYLSGYANLGLTGLVSFLERNKSILSGYNNKNIKLNREKINLIYQIIDKHIVYLSGNKLNLTGDLNKIKKIYETKYGKDLFILINFLKQNNLDISKDKESKVVNNKQNKMEQHVKGVITHNNKKESLGEKQKKLIEKNKEAIRKTIENTAENNNNYIVYIMLGVILLLMGIVFIFYKLKKKYEF